GAECPPVVAGPIGHDGGIVVGPGRQIAPMSDRHVPLGDRLEVEDVQRLGRLGDERWLLEGVRRGIDAVGRERLRQVQGGIRASGPGQKTKHLSGIESGGRGERAGGEEGKELTAIRHV
ncbi:MAG: hypothetical protein ACK55I_02440, partial [bacterium]